MTNQTRQPKGQPTGGQFAGSAHADADIDLATHPRVYLTVSPEQWINDYAVPAGEEVRVDITERIRVMSPEQRAALNDNGETTEALYFELVKAGLVEQYGPFSLSIRQSLEDWELAEEENPSSQPPFHDLLGTDPDDDLILLTHADGDFDTAEVGVDGIELMRRADGKVVAEAYRRVDLFQIAAEMPALNPDPKMALRYQLPFIRLAIADALGADSWMDENDGWEDAKIYMPVDVTGATSVDEIISRTAADVRVAALADAIRSETFATSIAEKSDEIAASDRQQERDGLRKIAHRL